MAESKCNCKIIKIIAYVPIFCVITKFMRTVLEQD
jgi:hypothetical protein